MSEKKSLIEIGLGWIKSTFFEKGNLIYWVNIPSFRRSLRKIKEREKGEKIRIGFLIQCLENWAVVQSVYEAACADEQVDPVVLLIPEMEYAFYVKLKAVKWERVYSFGEAKFGDQAVRTYNPDSGEWVNPETLQLDYVFIPRPYETYLPKQYRASSLRRLARVCYVPYAFPTLGDWQILYNTHFIRNAALIFCEKKSSESYVRKKLRQTIRTGDQKCFLCGYPKFDLIGNHEGNESPLWPRERKKEITRILWTPRWTTDPKLGGSNFFAYKDRMIDWAESDDSVDLLFRPHPMALENYLRTGLMTEEEKNAYLDRYARCLNANVDRTTEYFDTFYSSDILVTDISSMIMDYLFTGKPIIYCKSPEDGNIAVPELHECLYKAGSFEEIQDYVKQLKDGRDPKKELREQLVRQLRPENTAAANILEEIQKDYMEQ